MSEISGGGLIYTISDEDGNDYALEHVDTVEIDGSVYIAFLPADIDIGDERYGLLILQALGDDLARVDDEQLLESLYHIFMERLYEDEDEDTDEDIDDETS